MTGAGCLTEGRPELVTSNLASAAQLIARRHKIGGMEFEVIQHNGTKVVEAIPDGASILVGNNVLDAISACGENKTDRLLDHVASLPVRFFDLKSGEAGEMLQKLRNYRVGLAVVGGLAEAAASQRFSEMMIEENRQRWFHMFATSDAAVGWLCQP